MCCRLPLCQMPAGLLHLTYVSLCFFQFCFASLSFFLLYIFLLRAPSLFLSESSHRFLFCLALFPVPFLSRSLTFDNPFFLILFPSPAPPFLAL